VKAPRLLGIDGDMLISQVDYTIDDRGGKLAVLRVVRPDAFTPGAAEPSRGQR
jgi:prophage tail gpP-like protein